MRKVYTDFEKGIHGFWKGNIWILKKATQKEDVEKIRNERAKVTDTSTKNAKSR